MERDIPAAEPVLVASAVLTIAQRAFAVHYACGMVFLPQVFERFALFGECTADFFRIEVSVQFSSGRLSCLAVQSFRDEFVRDFLWQWI